VSPPPFYGKYRGVVSDNVDPLLSGRIKAQVPDVMEEGAGAWASACVACGADPVAVPAIGARVWIEFERGDPDYPIWSGCGWPDAVDPPAPAAQAPPPSGAAVVATAGGHTILIDDTPGESGIALHSAGGAMISVTDSGIVIDNGAGARITLTGPQVSINNGALDIT
jgi:uncharacterized protein involved in type VI secretion and phage assembly